MKVTFSISKLQIAMLAAVVVVAATGVVLFKRYGPEGGGQQPVVAGPGVVQAVNARFVYLNFASEADTLFLGSSDASKQAKKIAEIPHAREWGIKASVSPTGQHIAFTVMPPGARRPETDAEAWVVDVAGGGGQLLVKGVDLLSRPVWNSDGTAFTVRRYEKTGDGLLPQRIEIVTLDGDSRVAVRRNQTIGLYPIGFSGDQFFFAELTQQGTEMRVKKGGDEKLLEKVPGIARDWTLSPDGSRLAFLAPAARSGSARYRAFTMAATVDGSPAEVKTDAGDALGVIFQPGSDDLSVGGPAAGPVAQGVGPDGTLKGALGTGRGKGFDQPVEWSSDGRFLAIREFEGESVDNAGVAQDVVLIPDGTRLAIDGSFIGWVD